MRVLLGHNFYRSSAPSGEDSVYRNEVALLSDSGVDVHTVEEYSDTINDSDLRQNLDVAFSVGWSRRGYKAVADALAAANPDVAHFHNTFPLLSPSVYAACRDHGVAVVQTVHNFRNLCASGLLFRHGQICEKCIGRLPFPAIRYRCYRDSLVATLPAAWMVARARLTRVNSRMVDRFIAPTRFVAQKLARGGYPEQRICVKPHFLPQRPNEGTGAGGYAIFVGRLSAEKGVNTLLSAWSSIKSNMTLQVVGDGELREQLETRARTERLNVQFIGMQSRTELLKLIGDARFLIVPSECYETFGMTVIEAYACGTPVIASNLGGIAENVVDGKTGWTVGPGNANELAATVDRLNEDTSWIPEIRRNCRELFEERYTPERNSEALLDIYRQAIHGVDPAQDEQG